MEIDSFEELRAQEEALEAKALKEIESYLRTDPKPYEAADRLDAFGVPEELPGVLYRVWKEGVLQGERLEWALGDAWVHRRPVTRDLGERKWLEMFRATGFYSLVVPEVRIHQSDGTFTTLMPVYPLFTEQPQEPTLLWRGAKTSTGGRGMAWSAHRDCAIEFAQRHSGFPPHPEVAVYRAVVPPRAILAAFGDEREQEFVVNPNMLRGRIVLDEVIPYVETTEEAERRARMERVWHIVEAVR